MSAAKAKILPLESLRGLAAMVVVLFHCSNGSVLTNNIIVQAGPLMLDFFFILSGYVIGLSYLDRIKDLSDVVAFQRRRFWRLYPLHLFTLLAFLGIECLKFAAQRHSPIDGGSPAFSNNNLFAFVNNLFLTHGILLDRVSFNYPSWSISTEFYTHLMFAFVMLTGRFRLLLCVLLAFGAWLLLEAIDPHWQEVYTRVFRYMYSFFLGVLGAAFMKRYSPPVPNIAPTVLSIASLAAILTLADSPFRTAVPLIFLLTVGAFVRVRDNNLVVKILSFGPLVYLGTISYSMYMVHAMVWWVSNQILRVIFKVPSHENQAGQSIMDLDPFVAACVTLAGVAVVIGFAHLTYHHIEMRIQRQDKPRQAAYA